MTQKEKDALAAEEQARLAAEETARIEAERLAAEQAAKRSLKNLIGKEADDVTHALLANPDCTNFANVAVVNVKINVNEDDITRTQVTIVTNKNVPAFIFDQAEQAYVETTSKNVFTSVIQLSGILKGAGHLQLANKILDTPSIIPAIFTGAKVSFVTKFLAAGEEYVNPYSSREPDTYAIAEHDTHQIFLYDVAIADTSVLLPQLQLAAMLNQF